MIDFEHLRLFAQVAELGSLTKAALVLGKEQSAISRQISALESRIGGRLFHRTGRGVIPTELGERILPRVRAILAESDLILGEAKAPAGSVLANVRLGIIPSLSARLVKPLFCRIRKQYPGIRLHFFEDYSGQLDRSLDSNTLDIAVLLRDSPAIRPDEVALATWETHLIGPPGDPLTASGEIPFASLDRIPLILPSAPSGARVMLETIARKKGMSLSVVAEVNSGPVSYALLGGTGCYLIGPATPPLTTLARRVQAGHVQAARIVDPVISRTLTLSPSPVRPATQAEQIVMQMICEIIPELEAAPQKSAAAAPALIPEYDF